MDKIILVEGQEFSLEEFIAINTAEDVDPLPDNEIDELNNMQVNESIYLSIHTK